MLKKRGIVLCFLLIFTAALLGACAPAQPKPGEIIPPDPIIGNSGEFMCPYTQDGVVAPWVDKAVNASAAASAGKLAGAYVGSKALEQVPFIGGFLGSYAGEAIGRKVAIEASGGWEYIKETSDLSFNSLEDMSVWLFATKSENEHYQQVFKATNGIYPDLQKVYYSAISNAPRRQ